VQLEFVLGVRKEHWEHLKIQGNRGKEFEESRGEGLFKLGVVGEGTI